MFKLLKLNLNKFITRFCALYSYFLAMVFVIIGLFVIFVRYLFFDPTIAQVPLVEEIIIGMGVVLVLMGIYSIIQGYGLWNYKNYGRILLLISLYVFALFCLLYLIMGIIMLFTTVLLGIVFILIVLFSGVLLFLMIYLFQNHKQMVSVFK